MRRRVHTRGSNRGKAGGHKPSTHAPATRDRGGKPADSARADAPLHGGGAVLSPSQAQASLAQAQAQAAPRVERKLDFAGVADDAEREAEPAAPARIELLRAKPPQLLSCTELGRLLDTLLKNKFA